ncbi:DNA polymerase III, subunit gamma and tau [Candidatus Kaiserbacteria bacterium CG10_big_fil_rev_8_21_14_0_10_56_12]|uniref:DNA polymerase III subunit gamma/tau n=1 Tax=Candidatus Kaiserbacteria bacterium CG10_big_fil_rev_8_21_14_0_10_56_12 TaxID=1974611 RepID=A0A2H0U956_9BACT|nr:MAG: DNA polymerase III, subunit gamma and tau [Candidatus Kaiserbacteria bacterium CG10_big_fil_rev_8_21_14_0_10_56_12]
MAHQALYRTHRPTTFKDVVGQEQVTTSLSEVVKSGKIGHAYLFAGSRGLGKTSAARIFAREIGCKENDLYEIDAASNNSVEDIRALTEGVYTLPFESPYKVYLLDEVHMLSKGAWNAFLKTLEEPPPYAVFILATTELEKVPATVQSRCQVFEFKKPARVALAKMITGIAKKEGAALDASAADLIAMLAEGSYRDALTILQKVLTTGEKKLSRKMVEITTGAPRRELVHALVDALALSERGRALAAIEDAVRADIDLRLYLELVLETLRSVLLIRHAPDLAPRLREELGGDEFAILQKVAEQKGITHATMLAFLTASDRIRYAPIPALPLELAVLEALPE